MRHLIAFVSMQTHAAASMVPPGSAQPAPLLLNKHTLADASAVCNDGTRAAFYHRNCTANWDRKPWDNLTDFCAGTQTWVISFLSGSLLNATASTAGAFCYDSASCASRDAELRSSSSLPSSLYLDGVSVVAPETNPNLYKQHSVIVPYCTSDLWAGRTADFAGANVVDAVIRALGSTTDPLSDGGLATADRVILTGGAGIMARLDELAAALRAAKVHASGNSSATLSVFGICDGCALLLVDGGGGACTRDSNCPPDRALPALARAAALDAPPACSANTTADVWTCWAEPSVSHSLAAALTPSLSIAMQFDRRQLASYGALPTDAWAQDAFMPAARAAAARALYAISPACATPTEATASKGLFDEKLRHVDAYNNTLHVPVVSGLTTFLDAAEEGGGGPQSFGAWADTCGSAGCSGLCAD